MAKNIFSKIALTGLFLIANSQFVQAQEINSYEDFKLYCSDISYQYGVASPECDSYKQYHQNEVEELNQPQNIQPENNKVKRRNADDNDVSGYAGISLGAFFPDLDEANTGFGGSVFIGGQWNRYFATDIEFIYAGGGTDFDDIDYSVWGFALNPRLIIPFNDSHNSVSFYISPGLGISSAEIESSNISLEDETRLTWQIKAGLTIPVKEKFNIFLQGRYASQFEEDTIDFFSTELGFSVNF